MFSLFYPLTNYVETAQNNCKKIKGDLFDTHYVVSRALDDNPSHGIGNALVEFYNYDGFSIMYSKYRVTESVKIGRTYSPLKDHLSLDYILSGESEEFLTQANDKLRQLAFGCYISTPSTESYGLFGPDIHHELLSVLIHKTWLENFIGTTVPKILQNPNKPLYIHTPYEKNQASSLVSLKQSKPLSPLRKPYLYAKTIENVLLTLESLQNLDREYQQHQFPPHELEIILQLADWLSQHVEENKSIQELSELFGLNRNKLQFMFKSIYGQTIGNYAKYVKMNHAYGLLLKKYSVGEVGHRLGYSNISHFSKAFKKVHGINPSEVVE